MLRCIQDSGELQGGALAGAMAGDCGPAVGPVPQPKALSSDCRVIVRDLHWRQLLPAARAKPLRCPSVPLQQEAIPIVSIDPQETP